MEAAHVAEGQGILFDDAVPQVLNLRNGFSVHATEKSLHD